MKSWLATSALTLVLAAPVSVLAEGEATGGTGVSRGENSLSFGVPGGGNGYVGGAAGYWLMVAENINLGANVGLAFSNKPDTAYDVLLGPAIRYYMATSGDILPYIAGQLNFRLVDAGGTDDPELSLSGGLGVEWFVTHVFSISGFTGIGFDILQQGGSNAGFRMGTLTSGLTAQLYFQ